MTGAQTLGARAALGGVAVVCSLLLTWTKRFVAATNATFDRWLLGGFLATRVGIFTLVFLLLHIPPRGDVPFFYRPEALCVLDGLLPYRDFPSSYAPLHGFLDGLVLSLWNSPLALILFSILVEAGALGLLLRTARCGFSEERVRLAALLYVASPVSLQFVTVDGQDNVLLALLLAGAVLFLYRGRALLSGACLALGIALVKFLPLLFAPILFMACGRRVRWVMGFAGVLALGYVPFALLHLPLLLPLQLESQAKTASNLPYLLEAIFGLNLPGRAEDFILAIILLGILYVVGVGLRGTTPRARIGVVFPACAAITLALLLLSKKSWPPYLMLVWFPICLLPGAPGPGRLRLGAFVSFSWIAIFAHSAWATLFLQAPAADLHVLLIARDRDALLFVSAQMVLIAGYGWLLFSALRQCSAALRLPRSNPAPSGLVPRYAR